jgi:hypothetical protein
MFPQTAPISVTRAADSMDVLTNYAGRCVAGRAPVESRGRSISSSAMGAEAIPLRARPAGC